MPQKRLSQYFRELSFEQKMIAFGGLLAVISVFMPWYQDVDRFETGFKFYGITGPLYLVGLFFLATGLSILGTLFVNRIKARVENFGFKLAHFYLACGGFLLFLLILTNSVYFHQNFGVNITAKEFRFGMVLAFIATGLILAGGFFLRKVRPKLTGADLFGNEISSSFLEMEKRSHQALQKPTGRETHPQTSETASKNPVDIDNAGQGYIL